MNYKLKYWLSTLAIFYSLLPFALIRNAIIKENYFSNFNFSTFIVILPVIFVTASITSLAFIAACKPHELIFKYNTLDEKQNLLDKLDKFTVNNRVEFLNFKRDVKEVNGNVITYLTKNNLANKWLPPIQIAIEDEKIIVSGPTYYVKNLNKTK